MAQSAPYGKRNLRAEALEAKRAAERRSIRNSKVPSAELAGRVNGLYDFCKARLQEGFNSNHINMTAWVELPGDDPFPMAVIKGVIARFEAKQWTVEYSYNDDNPTFDHLGFTPPANWIERLLA